MPKNIFEEKKKLILFLSVLLILGFTLSGCNWFGEGILNVFDPQAQTRIKEFNYNDNGSVNFKLFTLNQVEFIGSGFKLEYYDGSTRASSLDTSVSHNYYVAPSSEAGVAGEETEISDLFLYTGEILDYVKDHKSYNDITCDLYLLGTDGAGHDIEMQVAKNLSALGVDTTNPNAEIEMSVNSGICPLTVIFDGSGSTDNTFGITSYEWEIPQVQSGNISTDDVFSYTFSCDLIADTQEEISVALTVTDYHGNQDTAVDKVTISKPESEEEDDGNCP